MSDNSFKAPDFLQIKGYKYRAKMLIAGAAILLVILIILISIINGISSAIHKPKSDSSDTDTHSDSSVTSTVAHISSNPYESSDTDSQNTASDTASKRTEEKFDADNKLIIDTDTLDGKKAVAITFDDGPGEYTQRLIEGLNERNAKATFFMCGNNVDKYPELLPLMVGGGHQIGNHTFSHSDLSTLSEAEIKDQISKTDESIQKACGQTSTVLRPPYGSHNTTVDNLVDKPIILWSLDTLDWKTRNEDSVYNEIISKCWDGDIILLHDIYSTSVDGVLMAIDELKEQGYIFVTVNELLTRYGYDIAPGTAHTSQYAVFETNSPHAAQYKEEMEDAKRRKAASEASQEAANAFYTASSDSDNNTVSSESYDDTYAENSQPTYDSTSSYDSFYDDPFWDEE